MVKLVKEIPYRINERAFWALLGYKKGKTEISRDMLERVERVLEKGRRVVESAGLYGLFPIENLTRREVKFHGKTVKSRSLAEHCRGFSHLYLMAVTIGEEFDALLGRVPLEEAVILDAFGSEAVEAVAESLNRAIEREGVHFGLTRFNRRFSPGYGDLPLKTNRLFEELLGLRRIGVRVSDRFSLIPSKSITAIIPAGG